MLVVGGIEEEVLAPLTQWEQEEDSRKQRLAGIVAGIGAKVQTYYPDIPSLTAAIAELESFDLSTMQEFKVSAESAIAASLKVLKPELERRKKAESDAKELEALRAAEAKRLEDERIAAAAKKLADEQVEARLSAMVEAAKQGATIEEIAELGVPAREYVEGPDSAPPSVRVASALSPGEQHHRTVWVEARQDFIEYLGLNTQDADELIQLIDDRRIRHITIQY